MDAVKLHISSIIEEEKKNAIFIMVYLDLKTKSLY